MDCISANEAQQMNETIDLNPMRCPACRSFLIHTRIDEIGVYSLRFTDVCRKCGHKWNVRTAP